MSSSVLKNPKRTSFFQIVVRQFWKNKGAVIGLAVLVLIALATIFASYITPYDPLKVTRDSLIPPSAKHIMGTDITGRDLFSRILFGARYSLRVGFIAVGISLFFGLLLGMFGGYFGGWIDAAIVMLLDVMLAFPSLLLALLIVATLGSGLTNVMIAVGISHVPTFARVIRSTVLVEKNNDYVDAARVVGAGSAWILFRHILPNAIPPLIILSTLNVGSAILSAASLGFLGLGAQPPAPEWGAMANAGRDYLQRAPWLISFPGLAILVTVLSANLVGDGLRDSMDPRLIR